MVRKTIVTTVMALVALTATAAWAQVRDFTLHNRTSYTITGFWFRAPGTDWVALRGETIGPMGSTEVHFTRSGPCYLQFRVQISTGKYAAFSRQFDFCSLNSIAIYYNADDEVFTARAGY